MLLKPVPREHRSERDDTFNRQRALVRVQEDEIQQETAGEDSGGGQDDHHAVRDA